MYVAFLYNTADVEYFYKTSVSIFPMPNVRCKSTANEHTLLNRKHTYKTVCLDIPVQLSVIKNLKKPL
jgi:hypothetical protein